MLSAHNRVGLEQNSINVANSRGSQDWKATSSLQRSCTTPKKLAVLKIEKLPRKNKHLRRYSSQRSKKSDSSDFSKYGVDVQPPEVVWRKWEPGVESTKNLTIKNISWTNLKLRFTSASSTTFQFIHPQPIFLSAGTSFTLPITFHPTKKIIYHEKIEFYSEDEITRFSVPIRAVLCEPEISLTKELDFGLVGVDDSHEKTFRIENRSEVMATFTWKVPPPFIISPSSGRVPAKSVAELKAHFCPVEAKSYDGRAVCSFGCFSRTLAMEGVGKYAQISVSNYDEEDENSSYGVGVSTKLRFGEVGVHNVVESYLKLTNYTHVKSYFSITKPDAQLSSKSPFYCTIGGGEIEAKKSCKLPIMYAPTEVGTSSIDYFEIKTLGSETKSVVKTTGTCIGPVVTLSTDFVDFYVCEPKSTVVRVVKITNESDFPITFQFSLRQNEGVFRCNPTTGVLGSKKYQEIQLSFTPTQPINYYRQIPVVIHEKEPLFIDMLGTCHTALVKPPVLRHHHLLRDKIHQLRGLTFLPPDVIQDQYKLNKIERDEMGYFSLPTEDPKDTTDLDLYNSSFDKYFDDGHNTIITPQPPHVTVDKADVWFGRTSHKETNQPPYATIQLTNHTRGKINVWWMNDPKQSFEVKPANCQIPPRKSSEFRLIFRPNTPNTFYSCEMECYVGYWCMRDYRLVNEDSLVVPWHVSVNAVGHTFDERNETFPPNIRLNTKQLSFPPVLTDGVSYKTIILEKTDDLPTLFHFDQDDNLEHFCVKPKFGVVDSNVQIVTLRYSPEKVEVNTEDLKVRVNDNKKHDRTIELFGSMEQPDMSLSNNNEMYFRPTHVKTVATCRYPIKNISRSPVRFRWIISSEDTKWLSVTPTCGVIQPSEVLAQEWSFRPQQPTKRLCRAFLLAWIANSHASIDDESAYDPSFARRYKVRAVGEGIEGEIKARERTVDFGSVVAGTTRTESVLLYNESHCDLRFKLSIEQFVNKDGSHSGQREPLSLQLSDWVGVVNARGQYEVFVHAVPYQRVLYAWSLYCELLDEEGKSVNPNSRFLLTEISAEGVYPTAAVVDVRPLGSGSNISKTQMWRWMNLDHLNLCLDSDPQESEVIYSAATRLSISRRPSLLTDSVMDFNFGAAPVEVEPTNIEVVLKNTGFVSLKWHFLLPKDIQITRDFWADSGEFSAAELHELFVQDNELFEISPSKGELKPKELTTVTLKYKHHSAGTHRLPVLFKIDHGKEIMLNFVGVTVEMERRYLHYVSTKHTFTPVAIGSNNALVQLYEMFNGGSTAIIYEVGLDAVNELQKNNFGRPILTCLNPRGEIAPCCLANLEWIFSPIEARSYTIDVPIHILGGETAVIRFVGIGYDSRKLQPSMLMTDPQHHHASDFSSLPVPQQYPVKAQNLQLSEERISFGNVPLYSRSRHIFFLQNKSMDRTISYVWHAANSHVNKVLSITPVKATVLPGQTVLTKVVFSATGRPSFYDLDLVCEIYDEDEQAEYRAELTAWEAEKKRRDQEFTITEQGYLKSEGKKLYKRKCTIPEHQRRLKSNMPGETRRYSTLPSIDWDEPMVLPSQPDLLETDQWPCPEPPRPVLTHLGVTARTHDNFEFRTYFSDKNDRQFIDRTVQIKNPIKAVMDDDATKDHENIGVVSDVEKDGLLTILSGLLRNILDDPTVIQSFKETCNEQIPLFNNFRTTTPAAHRNRQFTRDGRRKQESPSFVNDKQIVVTNDKTSCVRAIPSTPESLHRPASNLTAVSIESSPKRRESKADKNKQLSSKQRNQKKIKPGFKKESLKVQEALSEISESAETKPNSEQGGNKKQFSQELPSTKLINELLKTETSDNLSTGSSNEKTTSVNLDFSQPLIKAAPTDGGIVDTVKTMPEFGLFIEDIFANTLGNILEEAINGEVLLTARPRVVALPPSFFPPNSTREHDSSRVMSRSSPVYRSSESRNQGSSP